MSEQDGLKPERDNQYALKLIQNYMKGSMVGHFPNEPE
jgi:hypothetical protein